MALAQSLVPKRLLSRWRCREGTASKESGAGYTANGHWRPPGIDSRDWRHAGHGTTVPGAIGVPPAPTKLSFPQWV